MAVDVATLRELLRNLQLFRSTYEAEGVDVVIDSDGVEWCLHDLEYLYEQMHDVLPPRQYQAIRLCLIENCKEADAARLMGVSPTNPVAMYATSGLQNLVTMIQAGRFPRFRWDSQGVS